MTKLWTQEPLNGRDSASLGATKLAFIHSGGIAAALSSGHGLATGKAPFDPPPISPAVKVALCEPQELWRRRSLVGKSRGRARLLPQCERVPARECSAAEKYPAGSVNLAPGVNECARVVFLSTLLRNWHFILTSVGDVTMCCCVALQAGPDV